MTTSTILLLSGFGVVLYGNVYLTIKTVKELREENLTH